MEVLYRLSYVGVATLSLEAQRAVDERPAGVRHRRDPRAPAQHRGLESRDSDAVRQVRDRRQLSDPDGAARVAAVEVAGPDDAVLVPVPVDALDGHDVVQLLLLLGCELEAHADPRRAGEAA